MKKFDYHDNYYARYEYCYLALCIEHSENSYDAEMNSGWIQSSFEARFISKKEREFLFSENEKKRLKNEKKRLKNEKKRLKNEAKDGN